jgi:hypothetical protein
LYIQEILAVTRSLIITKLKGFQLIGLRVRTSTHRIPLVGETLDQASYSGTARCEGTIVNYCPVTEKHFVVFDERLLCPLWVVISNDNTDFLIGPKELRCSRIDRLLDQFQAQRKNTFVAAGDCLCYMCHQQAITVESLASGIVPMESASAENASEEDTRGDIRPNSVRCMDCNRDFHTYCCPDPKANRALFSKAGYICMFCYQCRGCCGANKWTSNMIDWSMKKVDSVYSSGDPAQPTCGGCVRQFKHLKEYCPICYKRYDQEFGRPIGESNNQSIKYAETEIGLGLFELLKLNMDRFEAMFVQPIENGHNSNVLALENGSSSSGIEHPALENGTSSNGIEHPALENGTSTAVANAADNAMSVDDCMIQCNECQRWVHAKCEGVDQTQFEAMAIGTHPVWGKEYLCPICRVDVGLKIVKALSDNDDAGLGIFAEPVTEAVAKNYYEVIRNPVDLSMMKHKAGRGQYKSLQSLRQDFEQMCLNAFTFNLVGDEYWEETLRFYKLSLENIFAVLQSTSVTRFGVEINELLNARDEELRKAIKLEQQLAKKPRRSVQEVNAENLYQQEYKTTSTSRRRGQDAGADDVNIDAAGKSTGQKSKQYDDSGMGFTEDSQRTTDSTRTTSSEEDTIVLCGEIGSDATLYHFELPKVLQDPNIADPGQFLSPTTFPLSQEDAFFNSYQDHCFVCGGGVSGSKAFDDYFLFCVDCGECFHSFCVSAPIATMKLEDRVCWRCPNCKVCELCGTGVETEANNLLFCENCDVSMHSQCLSPPVDAITNMTEWFCEKCVHCTFCKPGRGSCWGVKRSICIGCDKSKSGFAYKPPVPTGTSPSTETAVTETATTKSAAKEVTPRAASKVVTTSVDKDAQFPAWLFIQAMGSMTSSHHEQELFQCQICNKADSEVYSQCEDCKGRFHTQCINKDSLNHILPWLADTVSDFRCKSCLLKLVPRAESGGRSSYSTRSSVEDEGIMFSSHLGNSQDALRLLSEIGRINVVRTAMFRVTMAKNRESLELTTLSAWKPQLLLLKVIIVLGFAGCLGLKQQLDKKIAAGISLHSMFIGAPKWQLARASRFARLIWRDKVGETLEQRKARLADLFYKLKEKGQPIGAGATLRLASMAATFIIVTNACVGEDAFQQELNKSYEIFAPLWRSTFTNMDPNVNWTVEFKKEVMVSDLLTFSVSFNLS